MTELKNRYEFVLVFDVKDGNPNGDPVAGNLPRMDPETGQGLVTDVCLKRKIRNYVLQTKGDVPNFDIFVKEKAVLNDLIENAYAKEGIEPTKTSKDEKNGKKKNASGKGQGGEVKVVRARMCKDFYDIRTFGAVLSTGANAGQVRGPVQLTFARSVDPVVSLEHSLTRCAVATQEEAEKQAGGNRTFGRKNTISYGLYVGYGFISPAFASQTGFSQEDLDLLWEAMQNMFEHDHSAARGMMTTCKLIVFKHSSPLGNAASHQLFDLVSICKKDNLDMPPRKFTDYSVTIDKASCPENVEIIELV